MYLPIEARSSGETPKEDRIKELEAEVKDLKRRLDFLEDLVWAIEMRT